MGLIIMVVPALIIVLDMFLYMTLMVLNTQIVNVRQTDTTLVVFRMALVVADIVMKITVVELILLELQAI